MAAEAGGGGGDTATTATSATTTVTPSLGKFSKGTKVKLSKVDANLSEISTQSIDDSGSATFSLGGYTGAVVIEVIGDANSQYYDEKTKQLEKFGLGKNLRAVAPTAQAEIGVSALTNAATIKLETAGSLKSVNTTQINDANAKVAAVFGLPNILIAPKPIGSTTGKTLDIAAPGDKYALVLSALAKTGSDALTVATELANDLKQDDLLDGKKDSTGTTPVALANYVPANLATAYQDAAKDSATPTSESVVVQQPFTVSTDVSKVTGKADNPINIAKAMFAELRTTLNSFANGSKTGFLDTQATRMQADLTANVAPEMSKVANRISVLSTAVGMFEEASAANAAQNFSSGPSPFTPSANTLVRQRGSIAGLWYGYDTNFEYCWTDSPSGVSAKVSCAVANSVSYDSTNNNYKIKMVVIELTKTASNQYSYTAKRFNTASFNTNPTAGLSSFTLQTTPTTTSATDSTPIPAGNGTFVKTFNGTNLTGFAINGTLPPSATNAAGTAFTTGVDTIAITTTRTALATANNYRYTLSGSVSTANLADVNKVVTLSIDSGSYIDLNESTLAATGPQIVGAKFVGTAQTAATKFTGSIDVGAFATSKNSEYSPTSIVFNGSIADIRPTIGTGQILTGKLEATVVGYANFDSSANESSSNFLHSTMTFTGTVQAPSRPLLKLVAAVKRTGLTTGDTTLNYSYGTTSITGSGTVDSANSANNTMILSNQNGITVDAKTGLVSKSGTKVATLANGSISYEDGVTESLN